MTNLKHLIPTWRTRYRFVEDALSQLGRSAHTLNLGCGEGEFDPLLRAHSDRLHSCDINPGDVAFARLQNTDVDYSVQDAMALQFDAGTFDRVVCIDVIEHVPDSGILLAEVRRVLLPGGTLILTCPNHHYPITYDPFNLALRRFGRRIPLGAYGYGHQILVEEQRLLGMLKNHGFELRERRVLSHYLVGAVESYWLSAVQRLLKANAANRGTASSGLRANRPVPDAAVATVDSLIDLDASLFSTARRSIGLAYVMERI